MVGQKKKKIVILSTQRRSSKPIPSVQYSPETKLQTSVQTLAFTEGLKHLQMSNLQRAFRGPDVHE